MRRRGRREHGVGGARLWLGAASGGPGLGLAFGPETPASTALLGKLVTDERRALVFSVRQTGNQIGAVLGSLSLPAIAIWLAPHGPMPPWASARSAASWYSSGSAGLCRSGEAPPQLGMRARLALVSSDRRIAALPRLDPLQRHAGRPQNLSCNARRARARAEPCRGRRRSCLRARRRLGRTAWLGLRRDALGAARLILVSLGLGMTVCARCSDSLGISGKAGSMPLPRPSA